MVNLEQEPFKKILQLAIVPLLLALSAVIMQDYTKQGKQVFSKKKYAKIKINLILSIKF